MGRYKGLYNGCKIWGFNSWTQEFVKFKISLWPSLVPNIRLFTPCNNFTLSVASVLIPPEKLETSQNMTNTILLCMPICGNIGPVYSQAQVQLISHLYINMTKLYGYDRMTMV